MTAVTFLIRPINIISGIIMARLLDPHDFGVVALAMLVFTATNLFSGLGMDSALIHTKLPRRQTAFPAFLTNMIISSLLFLLVFPNAHFWAGLLGNEEVVPVVRVLSLLILLDALYIIPAALLRKDLRIGWVSTATLLAEIANTTLSLTLAWLGFGYWSLVYGKIIASVTRNFVVWRACEGWDWIIPRRWRWADLRELLGFGIQNTSSGFLSFFNSNWDDWLVGRVLGTTPLGFYSKAYNLSNKTITGFNRRVMSGVFFPSFARIQDDRPRLARLYLKTLGIVALVMTPMALGVLAVAQEGVPILLGEKWIPMIPTLQIFALMALIRPLSGTTSPLFQAVGRPNYNVHVGLLLLGVMAPLVLLLLSQGIVGVAFAVTFAHLVGLLFNVYQANRILPGVAPQMLRAVLPALISGGMMVTAVYVSKPFLADFAGGQHNWLTLTGMVLVGAVTYLAMAYLLQKTLIREAVLLFWQVLQRRRRRVAGRPQMEGQGV